MSYRTACPDSLVWGCEYVPVLFPACEGRNTVRKALTWQTPRLVYAENSCIPLLLCDVCVYSMFIFDPIPDLWGNVCVDPADVICVIIQPCWPWWYVSSPISQSIPSILSRYLTYLMEMETFLSIPLVGRGSAEPHPEGGWAWAWAWEGSGNSSLTSVYLERGREVTMGKIGGSWWFPSQTSPGSETWK